MNKCEFVGRLTADVVLKETSNGTVYGLFALAVDRRFKKEGQPRADFPRIIVWGRQAEILSQYTQKGDPLSTVCRVQTRDYEKDGIKHYVTEFVLEEFGFIGRKRDKIEAQTVPQERAYTETTSPALEPTEEQCGFEVLPEEMFPYPDEYNYNGGF
ncbi:MAG: single-stranded DNA-binding protein [Eubacterium sp.]